MLVRKGNKIIRKESRVRCDEFIFSSSRVTKELMESLCKELNSRISGKIEKLKLKGDKIEGMLTIFGVDKKNTNKPFGWYKDVQLLISDNAKCIDIALGSPVVDTESVKIGGWFTDIDLKDGMPKEVIKNLANEVIKKAKKLTQKIYKNTYNIENVSFGAVINNMNKLGFVFKENEPQPIPSYKGMNPLRVMNQLISLM